MTELAPIHVPIAGWAERSPDSPALRAETGETLTYGDLAVEMRAVRDRLRGLGIGLEDRVAFSPGVDARSALLVTALWSASVGAPLDPEMPRPELEQALSRLRPATAIASEGEPIGAVAKALGIPVITLSPRPRDAFRFRLEADPVAAPSEEDGPRLDHAARILCTSGTSGRPKLVPCNHRMLAITQQIVGRQLQLGPDDCGILAASLAYSLGQVLLGALLSAGAVTVCPGELSVARLRTLVDAFGVTSLHMPATLLVELAREYRDSRALPLSGIRAIRSGASRLDPGLRDDVERTFGAPILDNYSSSEAVNLAGDFLDRPRRRGSVGPVLMPMRIMHDGAPAPPGVNGEIQVRGVNVVDGYFDDPEATAAAFTADGWFRTGDLGRIEDGYLTLAGREAETIDVGGRKVDPFEVEAALAGYPGIVEAAVFAIGDSVAGERVALAFVPEPGASVNRRALRRHLLERLSPWKAPTVVREVSALPRTVNGKVKRAELARMAREV